MRQNPAMGKTAKSTKSTMVWDLPTRLFHWLLTLSVIAAVGSVKAGNMFVHEKAGITVAALVVFRVVWGLVGSHYSRFAQFVTGPAAVIGYIRRRVRGDRAYHPGHAPTGGWATVLILAVLGGMAGLGLMANDGILYQGPLAAWAGDFSRTATRLHHIGERVVIAVVVLHLLAILVYYLWLKLNLLPAMLHGGKGGTAPKAAATGARQTAGVALMVALLLAAHALGMMG